MGDRRKRQTFTASPAEPGVSRLCWRQRGGLRLDRQRMRRVLGEYYIPVEHHNPMALFASTVICVSRRRSARRHRRSSRSAVRTELLTQGSTEFTTQGREAGGDYACGRQDCRHAGSSRAVSIADAMRHGGVERSSRRSWPASRHSHRMQLMRIPVYSPKLKWTSNSA
jgi:hypothetical protein